LAFFVSFAVLVQAGRVNISEGFSGIDSSKAKG
jgi:hypothetical protein